MKKILSLLIFSPLALLAQSGSFTVSGNISGVADGAEVKITSANEEGALLTKTTSKGGVFTLTGSVPEPGLYWLTVGKEQPQHIYLENAAIKISGEAKNLKAMLVEGSQAHADFVAFRNRFNPLVGELQAADAKMNRATSREEQQQYMLRFDSLKSVVDTEVGQFVKAKSASFVSPFLLFITAQILEDPTVMEQRYNSLSEPVRSSQIGKSLAEFIAFNKVGAIGTDAPEFAQADPQGKMVSLSSFRGKYVLIDFWASWCKPCRQENPNVVAAYNQFKAKNFTVFGVSLDQKKEAWLDAIKKDGLDWTQVSDLKFWQNEAAQLYHVQGIPQNFLVDPNGKIVGKNLRGPALKAKLEQLLK